MVVLLEAASVTSQKLRKHCSRCSLVPATYRPFTTTVGSFLHMKDWRRPDYKITHFWHTVTNNHRYAHSLQYLTAKHTVNFVVKSHCLGSPGARKIQHNILSWVECVKMVCLHGLIVHEEILEKWCKLEITFPNCGHPSYESTWMIVQGPTLYTIYSTDFLLKQSMILCHLYDFINNHILMYRQSQSRSEAKAALLCSVMDQTVC
jgi:hypothetical protein